MIATSTSCQWSGAQAWTRAPTPALRWPSRSTPQRLGIDLEAQTVTDDDGWTASFDVDAFRKEALIKGMDEVGSTLTKTDKIADFETAHPARW